MTPAQVAELRALPERQYVAWPERNSAVAAKVGVLVSYYQLHALLDSLAAVGAERDEWKDKAETFAQWGEKIERERDELRADAERWQFAHSHPGWLRQVRGGKWACANPMTNYEYEIFSTALEAIDTARAALAPGGGEEG